MTGALVVFAKAPRPGAVKTRLCPPFSLEQAADFYSCLLDDVLEASAAAARAQGLDAVLAVHPPEAEAELGDRAPAPFRTLAQRGADLAERMHNAVVALADQGRSPVLLRGSDSPGLGPAAIGAALAALGRADLVLAPDPDGGYGLVGLAVPAPGLFNHAMSTGSVLEDTLSNARKLGLRVALLEPGFDVDTAADLEHLARARARGCAGPCPRTLAWLDSHGGWQLAGVGSAST